MVYPSSCCTAVSVTSHYSIATITYTEGQDTPKPTILLSGYVVVTLEPIQRRCPDLDFVNSTQCSREQQLHAAIVSKLAVSNIRSHLTSGIIHESIFCLSFFSFSGVNGTN